MRGVHCSKAAEIAKALRNGPAQGEAGERSAEVVSKAKYRQIPLIIIFIFYPN